MRLWNHSINPFMPQGESVLDMDFINHLQSRLSWNMAEEVTRSGILIPDMKTADYDV